MAISDYLNSLISDRDTLVDNLKAKGVSTASKSETFTTLVAKVLDISTGIDIHDSTVTENDLLSGVIAYSSTGEKLTGTIVRRPTTHYTPTKASQTYAAGEYMAGAQIIDGDDNFIPANIKAGVTIWNVEGTYEGIDPSDATATQSDIRYGKTAYINGGKKTGTMQEVNGTTISPTTQDQIAASNVYVNGDLIFKGDINLISANIKSGATIFGVSGNSNVIDTSAILAEAASSSNIAYGKKAFVNGQTIVGSAVSLNGQEYTSGSEDLVISGPKILNGQGESFTIKAISNLQAQNIKAGVTVGGVEGTYTSDANATAGDIYPNKTAYVNGVKVIGNMPVIEGSTITPSDVAQTISGNAYLSGDIIISAITNLSAANIKAGVTIAGTLGTYTSDGNATAGDMKNGKTAYVNGEKITGNAYTLNSPYTFVIDGTAHSLRPGFYNGISVPGEANFIPANIKAGVTLYGIEGTYTGSQYDAYVGATVLEYDHLDSSKRTANFSNSDTITLDTDDKVVSTDITLLKDTNLIASNIKKDIVIYGITGTYEGPPKSEIVIINTLTETTAEGVVSLLSGVVQTTYDGSFETWNEFAEKSSEVKVGAYLKNGGGYYPAGIGIHNCGANAGILCVANKKTITNNHFFIKYMYYVDSWVTPTLDICFVDAADLTEAKTKISNSNYTSVTITLPGNSAFINTPMYKEVDNISAGSYYIFVKIPSSIECNEAILKLLTFVPI